MTSLSIKVEVIPGSSIESASADAIQLAEKLGIGVDFKFNGVTCIARGGDNPEDLAAAWRWALESNHTTKVCSAITRKRNDE